MKQKVAIYVRVSTTNQAEEGYSIGEQVDKLKKYCEIMGWNVSEIYTDAGFTGSNIDRPALQSLIKDAEHGRFNTVLVYKLDRLSRSQKDTLYLIEDIFNKHDVGFLSLQEKFDTTSAFGKAMIGILSVFAQLEREQIKERVSLGRLGRAKSGKATGYTTEQFIPFGYDYDRETGNYTVNGIQSAVVKEIFSDYLSGMGLLKIKNKLNMEGHIGKTKPWAIPSLRVILTNQVYTGVVKFKGQIFNGNHEAIIPKEMFSLAKEELHRRQDEAYKVNGGRRAFQAKYITGGLTYCGYCGSVMKSETEKRNKKGTSGVVLICRNKYLKKSLTNGEKCESPRYKKVDVESKIIDAVYSLQKDPSIIDEMLAEHKQEVRDVTVYEMQIEKLQKKMKKLSDLYMVDAVSLEDLKNQTNSIKSEIKGFESKIEYETKEKSQQTAIDKLKKMLADNKDIHELTYEDQKKMVNSLIKRVELTAENVRIDWVF